MALPLDLPLAGGFLGAGVALLAFAAGAGAAAALLAVGLAGCSSPSKYLLRFFAGVACAGRKVLGVSEARCPGCTCQHTTDGEGGKTVALQWRLVFGSTATCLAGALAGVLAGVSLDLTGAVSLHSEDFALSGAFDPADATLVTACCASHLKSES